MGDLRGDVMAAVPFESKPAQLPIVERRRRMRTKISAPVRVRTQKVGAGFQAEVCTTVDVSRDGIFFTTARSDYEKGMDLAITFPYSGAAGNSQREQNAVVARVVELPENRWGVGVRFYTDRRLEAAPEQKKAARAAGESKKVERVILAVDAEAGNREIMRASLEAAGYTVEAVSTGAEAVEFLRQGSPSLIIAEIETPDMSGYDLCLIAKSNERLQNVPIVMTTRAGQPNDYSTAHALGAIVCMSKPYKQERLLHVARLLAPIPEAESAPAPAPRNGRNGHGHRR